MDQTSQWVPNVYCVYWWIHRTIRGDGIVLSFRMRNSKKLDFRDTKIYMTYWETLFKSAFIEADVLRQESDWVREVATNLKEMDKCRVESYMSESDY